MTVLDITTTVGKWFRFHPSSSNLSNRYSEVPLALPNVEGMNPCRILTSTVKRLWVVPYLEAMVFEAGSSDFLASLSWWIIISNRRVGFDAVQGHTVTDP